MASAPMDKGAAFTRRGIRTEQSDGSSDYGQNKNPVFLRTKKKSTAAKTLYAAVEIRLLQSCPLHRHEEEPVARETTELVLGSHLSVCGWAPWYIWGAKQFFDRERDRERRCRWKREDWGETSAVGPEEAKGTACVRDKEAGTGRMDPLVAELQSCRLPPLTVTLSD